MACDYMGGWDLGTSLYSALLHAINNTFWNSDPDVSRAIILLPGTRACYWLYGGACDIEPGSGISQAEVIDAALAADVQIFPINSKATNLEECTGTPCTSKVLYCYQWPAARDEFVALAEGTGGQYHDAAIGGPFCGYPADYEAVIEVLKHIAGNPLP
jgi:hypothetical protein